MKNRGAALVTEITLTAIYEEAEEGGYIGYVAELPGANTQGETLSETRENLLEAVQLVLESNREVTERRLASVRKITRERWVLRSA
jgi:predicted RNase H-like HicB family nuclease